ncbi:hypothetical protein RCL1_007660 [Eukaryota sp. TZLM3-RCL]
MFNTLFSLLTITQRNSSNVLTVCCNLCQKEMTGKEYRFFGHFIPELRNRGAALCKSRKLTENLIALIRKEAEGSSTTSVVCDSPDLIILSPQTRQTSLHDYATEGHEQINQSLMKFFACKNIAFAAVESEELEEVVENLKIHGRNYKLPKRTKFSTTVLKNTKTSISADISVVSKSFHDHGFSLLTDSWTNVNGATIINVLFANTQGSIFHKLIECKTKLTGLFIYTEMKEIIEHIGPEKVVQIVTDNGANFINARKLLLRDFPHIFSTSCSAHCLDLFLEDSCKLLVVSELVSAAKKVITMIRTHGQLERLFFQESETIGMKPLRLQSFAATRFYSNFLTFERLCAYSLAVVNTFLNREAFVWVNSLRGERAEAIREQFQQLKTVVNNPIFWSRLSLLLLLWEPIVQVIKTVDSNSGYISTLSIEVERAKNDCIAAFPSFFSETQRQLLLTSLTNRTRQLHSPIHYAAELLHPNSITLDPSHDRITGLYDVFQTLMPEQAEICAIEYNTYLEESGQPQFEFVRKIAEKMSPEVWWRRNMGSFPTLQKIAMKVLCQISSTSEAERNFSMLSLIQSDLRNRMKTESMDSVSYISFNIKLMRESRKRRELKKQELKEWSQQLLENAEREDNEAFEALSASLLIFPDEVNEEV